MTLEAPYRRQLFVCTYGAWCRLEGSEAIRDELKRLAKQAGLQDEIRITKSGCFGQCGHGPNAVMWPDNVWYAGIEPTDVPEIFESHVRRGVPVERLRYRPEKPGTNKTRAVREQEAASRGQVD